MGIFNGYPAITDKNELYRQYISEHVANVQKALNDNYDAIKTLFPSVNMDELKHSLKYHDNSKTAADEFIPYRKKFFPEDGEKITDDEFNVAWLYHVHHNPHHWNYWVLVDNTGDKTNITALEMPDIYLVEMILDWTAMGYKFGNDPLSYYNSINDGIILNDNTRTKLERALQYLFG